MSVENKQYFGLKFPFTANNFDGVFVDLNSTIEDKIISEIAHVVLTPKRSRIRKPDFGTNLVKYLFENNDELSWESVENEIKESVKRYVPNVEISDVSVIRPNEDPHALYLAMTFVFHKGKKEEYKQMVIKL